MGSLIICFTGAYIIYYYLNYGKETSNQHKSFPNKVTPQAKALYQALVKLGIRAKLDGFINNEFMAISILEAKITIEIDVKSTTDDKGLLSDLQRTYYSLVDGHYIVRIPNSLIKNNLTQAIDYISRIVAHNQRMMEQDTPPLIDYSLILKKAS